MLIQALLQQSRPDNWPEAVATLVIALISWWLGRKRPKKKEEPPLDNIDVVNPS